jgi:phosphoglycerol transferase MdoB-like AlkP superfamily enzyme
LLIYAPQHFKPFHVQNLTSQIDVIPTLLGLLHFDYPTKFFGTDAINHPANRAFIATYQLLGYLQNQQLLILSPGQQAQTYNIVLDQQIQALDNQELAASGISCYQLAYLNFKNRLMNNFK